MYKITFQMASGISFIDPPTFDGILSYAYARELNKDKPNVTKLNYSEEELIDFSGMPIKLHPDGYFLASQMMYNESLARESVQHWRKRWNSKHEHLSDFGKNKRKIDSQRGEFKSYEMPIRIITAPQVWFIFESDDVKEVERLVSSYIFSIGKKRTTGHGEVIGFEIEKTDEKIIRQIPFNPEKDGLKAGTIKLCTWKPPYWDTSKAEICIITELKTT